MLQRASAIAALLWLPQAGKVVATNPTCYALIGGLDENGIFVSSQFAGADHTRRISWVSGCAMPSPADREAGGGGGRQCG
jgi:ribosomal protein L2